MPKVLQHSYDQLVERAQQVFWMSGFKGTSTQDLSKELDVSTSVIYNKYTKDMLFLDSIDYYTSTYSDPFLKSLRESTEGLKSLENFFYALIEALLDGTFPKSCLMVNTIVELRNEYSDVVVKYGEYIDALKASYKVVLEKAADLGQIQATDKQDDYAEYLLGMIFSMSVFYKIRSKEELQEYVRNELALIQ